jgi:FeS assembly protein IscX
MNWDDYQAVGRALFGAHPNVNYLTLSNDDLRRLVIVLPGFDAPSAPPDVAALSAIRFAWVALAEGADDSGPYDGSA